MATIQVFAGFSPINRALIYVSALLGPSQFVAGMGHSGLSSLGFLAFNWYSQIIMYRAAHAEELHALALVATHINTTLAIAYLAGIFSGNRIVSPLLALGTSGVMWLNCASAWNAWRWSLPKGYGKWQFFFFGWRTLTPGWRKLITAWQVFNTLEVLGLTAVILLYSAGVVSSDRSARKRRFRWWNRLVMLPVGAATSILVIWPLILWMELIIRRNHIESETDWGAVWAFVAQIGCLLIPSFACLGDDDGEYLSLGAYLGFA